MPKENRMDRITDLLGERLSRVMLHTHKQLKGTKPYRKEPVTTDEMIYNYSQLTPDMEQQMRQQMIETQGSDANMNAYHASMQKIINRRQL